MASGGARRPRPRRRSRAKAKKTKYLSLSRHLIKAEPVTPPPPPSPWQEAADVTEEDGGDGGGQQELVVVEPFGMHHEECTLFAAAPSLADILGATAVGDESAAPSPEAESGGTAGFQLGAKEEDLARRALRGRERWVYCTSSPSPATTTTTSSSSPCSSAASTSASARSLLLKLDYEEILATWADRGSLYIGGNRHAAPVWKPKPEPELEAASPHALREVIAIGVPALVPAFLGHTAATAVAPPVQEVFVEVEPSHHAAVAASAWSALETAGPGRAERVSRYKEKRRSRLFAKRIRYEVRRVNAVKRPRFKGRFIKENDLNEEIELQAA